MIKLTKGEKPEVLVKNSQSWKTEYVTGVKTGNLKDSQKYRYRHPRIKEALRAPRLKRNVLIVRAIFLTYIQVRQIIFSLSLVVQIYALNGTGPGFIKPFGLLRVQSTQIDSWFCPRYNDLCSPRALAVSKSGTLVKSKTVSELVI